MTATKTTQTRQRCPSCERLLPISEFRGGRALVGARVADVCAGCSIPAPPDPSIEQPVFTVELGPLALRDRAAATVALVDAPSRSGWRGDQPVDAAFAALVDALQAGVEAVEVDVAPLDQRSRRVVDELLQVVVRKSAFGEPGDTVLRALADGWSRFVDATAPEYPPAVYGAAAGRLREAE